MFHQIVDILRTPRLVFDDEGLHTKLDDQDDDRHHGYCGAGVTDLLGESGQLVRCLIVSLKCENWDNFGVIFGISLKKIDIKID